MHSLCCNASFCFLQFYLLYFIIALVNREDDEGPGVVQMPPSQSHTEQASQSPLGHEEGENENIFVNGV